MVLESFPISPAVGAPKEPTGAVYQAIAFGFIRADYPHLQVETRKVRTGSKRKRGIGDIDGWDGGRLALTAEVKQYRLKEDAPAMLTPFATEVARRAAIGIVMGLAFDEGVREKINATGLQALDRENLCAIVRLWDPIKQRIAVSSMMYHIEHVESKSPLARASRNFGKCTRTGELFYFNRKGIRF
jgi:hypothetical protein